MCRRKVYDQTGETDEDLLGSNSMKVSTNQFMLHTTVVYKGIQHSAWWQQHI
jgi:hypothetical protein